MQSFLCAPNLFPDFFEIRVIGMMHGFYRFNIPPISDPHFW